MRDLKSEEYEKLAQLRRVKLLATLVLLLCFVVLVITKILEVQYPWLAVVASFAEAATIGGIADWYAVVALFKRPLNLPFPHTAIIPNNQHRIADNLGRFIESNFLARAQIEPKLREIDFASEMATWLASRERSANLAQFAVRLVPQLLESVDQKGLVAFASDRVTAQLQKTDVAPMVGNAIEAFTKDGRTQKLLDEVIKVLDRFLQDDETISVMRAKVQQELPVVANIFRADAMVLNRILGAVSELLTDVREDTEHPLRDEFEVFLKSYVRKAKRTKTFERRVEAVKQQLLDRPELGNIAQTMWESLRRYVIEDVEADTSQLAEALTDLLVDVGESLKADPEIRADINAGMVTLLANLVEEQRGAISSYIAEQVRTWDMQQLITLIEVNVGRDLQFIRFNGMLIGGFVGVCLYVIERLLLH